ncbi:MAG: C40 family peptidase [Mycobacteriales bacterium]
MGRRRFRRTVVLGLAALTVCALGTGGAGADPGGQQVPDVHQPGASVADEVGRISAQLSAADAAVRAAQARAELAMEGYNKALVDERRAADDVAAAGRASADAGRAVHDAETRVGEFARRSYQDGGIVTPLNAFLARHPAELLHDASILKVLGRRESSALGRLQLARLRQGRAEAGARQALERQRAARVEAQNAKAEADRQVAASRAGANALAGQKSALEARLAAAQSSDGALRQAREAAEARARQAAAAAAAGDRAAGSAPVSSGSGDLDTVIRAALSQLGQPYVWGGESPDVGFDCSGLVKWAYAKIGVELPHYSGYQYGAGRHVSRDELRPGDLLFYSSDGTPVGIHHVVMYLGGGRIVEAADFGIPVHVVSVYWGGYLGATRVVG